MGPQPGAIEPKPSDHPEQTATADCRVEIEFSRRGVGAAMKATLVAKTKPGKFVANAGVYGYIQNRVRVTFGPSEAPALHYIGDLEHNIQEMADSPLTTKKAAAETSTTLKVGLTKILTFGCDQGFKRTEGTDVASKEKHCDGFGVKRVDDGDSRVGSESRLLFVRSRGAPGVENFIAPDSAGEVSSGTELYEAKMRAEWELTGDGYAEFTIEVKQGLVREVRSCRKILGFVGPAKHHLQRIGGVECRERFKVWKNARALLQGAGDIQLLTVDEGGLAENPFEELFESIGSVP
eukprot:TRINITY_DN19198_c0_g1_i1.p1 TRINITY_DN19198_c0_g1~~TRINITY_DN19198_c0_g1_i1.p1  ORF type:complete len:329 (-),score=70.55 TRINITY_DN19198_c0_g1_i1:387-1265(-)